MPITRATVTVDAALPAVTLDPGTIVAFTLSEADTEGGIVIPVSTVRVTVADEGDAAATVSLWRNDLGLRGTHYVIGAWIKSAYQELGRGQVSGPTTLAALLDTPVPDAPGYYRVLLSAEVNDILSDARVEASDAATSALVSQDWAEASEGFANAAATYATGAAASAQFFATIALGRAAVADGATFGVVAGGSDGLTRATIYRRDSGSTQTAIVALVPGPEFDALGTALGTTPSAGDWNFAHAFLTGDPSDPATRMPGMFDRQGRFAAGWFRLLASSTALGDMNLVYGLGDVKGRYAIGITPKGRVVIERHNERRYTRPVGSDRPQMVAAVTDIHAERGSLIHYSDGTLGFQPDRATGGRIAAKMAEGMTLAAIATTELPGNVGGLVRAGVDLWRCWSDVTGVNRPYLARGRRPRSWMAEGRDKLRVVPKTGESTNEGAWASPIRQSVPPAPNTAFMAGSLRGHGDRTFNPGFARGLASAMDVVETNGSTTLGSTGLATCGALIEAMSPASARLPHVFGTHGRSGEVIANLQSGSVYFTNFLAWLARVQVLAAEYQGKGVECREVALTLGANDRSATTANATFRAGMVALQASYQTLINAALGQTGEVALFIDQLAAARDATGVGISASQIAQAQLDSALGDAGIYLYLAKYILPYAAGANGNVHFSALGMDIMGEYLGKALYRRRVHSATRFCPMPNFAGLTIVGSTVTLPVDLVPVPGVAGQWFGLTSSTDLVEAATNLGFAATGTRTVSGVSIAASGATTGTATIQVTLSGAPGVGDALEYAYTGTADNATHACAWGNVHDIDTQASVTDAPRILRNPLPAFRKVLA